MEQRVVHFQGRVQGVGFRYTTCQEARALNVTGYVKNLPDGRVELVAEGEPAELDRLLAGVREQLGGFIRSEQTDTLPATGHYNDFRVTH
ncbi:Acylphosphatase [Posidoniimonas polymericola]|uniref:acylphosphatase n=1 Tax=Posidoniimonas polymericola TaxID=2528002 RepID=A0A5C5XYF5_9BACT|nr:acylphosphatase [Posidoniimonas polymericola]TWT67728.1 Acylphosphatase [Posidoniimonas polymericola]